jgi:hypothetical protein
MLSDEVLNRVVVTMLVTATADPLIVSKVAVGLPLPTPSHEEETQWLNPDLQERDVPDLSSQI